MHKDERETLIYRHVSQPYISNYKDFNAFINRIIYNI